MSTHTMVAALLGLGVTQCVILGMIYGSVRARA